MRRLLQCFVASMDDGVEVDLTRDLQDLLNKKLGLCEERKKYGTFLPQVKKLEASGTS